MQWPLPRTPPAMLCFVRFEAGVGLSDLNRCLPSTLRSRQSANTNRAMHAGANGAEVPNAHFTLQVGNASDRFSTALRLGRGLLRGVVDGHLERCRSMVGRSRSFAESCKPLAYRSPYLSSEAAAPRPRRHFAQLGHSLRRPILLPPSGPLFRAVCAMSRPSERTLLGGMHRASRPEPHRNLPTQRCRRRPSPATPRATRDVPVTPRLSSAPARRRSRLHDAPCQVRCVRGLFRGGAAHFVCAEGGPETRMFRIKNYSRNAMPETTDVLPRFHHAAACSDELCASSCALRWPSRSQPLGDNGVPRCVRASNPRKAASLTGKPVDLVPRPAAARKLGIPP